MYLSVSSPSSPRAKSFPVSAYLRIKREPQEVEDTCISWRFSQGICRADYQKWIITYIKEAKDSPKEFGAQRGREVLGEEFSLINLERGADEPKLKGWISQRPTCLEDNPERDLMPMRCCA